MNETHQADHAARPAYRLKPDGSIDPAGEAGWFLQRERERRGLMPTDIANVLGIHESHLEGIETGDLAKLPPRSEALAMVGIYACYLGFDPEPLTLHYSRFLPPPAPANGRSRNRAPAPLSSAKIIPFERVLKQAMSARGIAITGSVAGAVMLFGVITALLSPVEDEQIAVGVDSLPTASLNSKADDGSEVRVKESPLTEDLSAVTPVEAAPQVPERPKLEGGLDDLAPFINEQLKGSDTSEDAGEVKANQKAEAVSPQATGRIVLKATGLAWFRLEDPHGNIIASQTLKKGGSYLVPDRDDLVIISRDGGAITYEIDGIDRGSIGTPGEIVVGKPLSVSKLIDTRG
jgi:cytoskeletal protein RodZ